MRTEACLRKYFRLSVELGRLPSLLGREFFRTRVTSYRMNDFEDAVIFAHDVERCLEKLDPENQRLIAWRVFQDYSQDETARMLGYSRKTVLRKYPEALDAVTALFLERGLLAPIGKTRNQPTRRESKPEEVVKPAAGDPGCDLPFGDFEADCGEDLSDAALMREARLCLLAQAMAATSFPDV
ncbi:MAG TPA: sigma factor-like helix-turn-helix DNA-binding protein [Terriglobales bacterium]|nr:sigma factor-like helix-turn-helix DNA-binding protein [Terriglobales bacterium]